MTSVDRRAVEVQAEAVVLCAAGRARDRLWALLAADDRDAQAAFDVRLIVGPGRGTVHKQVRAGVAAPRERRGSYVLTMRWEPTGRLAAFYPSLDARVGITPIDNATCLLTVVGHYVPPLGAVGSAADRAVLHRVADSTVRAVAHRLASTAGQASATTEEEVSDERDTEHAPVRG